jgi:serine/threonine-protein kinase/endoribonuclease IRE1
LQEKLLTYLQEVSDRVDREKANSPILLTLERGAGSVLPISGNWLAALQPAVTEDLLRTRACPYREDLLKDLLRAIR